jgi:uncharacterized membrane protein (DUF485 family)
MTNISASTVYITSFILTTYVGWILLASVITIVMQTLIPQSWLIELGVATIVFQGYLLSNHCK